MLRKLSENGFLQRKRQYIVRQVLLHTGEVAVIRLRNGSTGGGDGAIKQF